MPWPPSPRSHREIRLAPLFALCLPALPALAQVAGDAHAAEGGASGADAVLGLLGLSCGMLILLAIAAFFFHGLCIFVGTRVAGLRASFGRALLTALASSVAAVPVMFAFGLVSQAMSPVLQNTISQILIAAVEATLIKLLYQTDYGRAALSYLVAAILTTLGGAITLILLF